MGFPLPQLLACGHIPEMDRRIEAPGRQDFGVGRKSHRVKGSGIRLQMTQKLARLRFSQPHIAIIVGECEQAAVLRNRAAPQLPGMRGQAPQLLPGAGIPEADGLISAGGQYRRAICRKYDECDMSPMPAKLKQSILPRGQVEHAKNITSYPERGSVRRES